MTLQKLGLVEINDETNTPYSAEDPKPVTDLRHESHAAMQLVVAVTHSTAVSLANEIEGGVPSWVTACRLSVDDSDVVYSTDGDPPTFSGDFPTHGVPLDAYTRGYLIPGAASVAALQMIGITADVSVVVELLG